MKIAARFISYLFHPLLLPTYLFSLLALVLPVALNPVQVDGHSKFVFLILIVTFLLPACSLALIWQMGFMPSLTMQNREERILPSIFVSCLYALVTFMFHAQFGMDLSDNVFKFFIIGDVLIWIATIITFFYKISVHSLAVWGLIGIILPLNRVTESDVLVLPTIGLILLAGIIMSSRLYLHVHNTREILLGTVVGLASSSVGMIILF